MAAAAWSLLAALGIKAPHIIGLSLGGCVALQMTCQRPDAVGRLVLVNTFARLQSSGLRQSRLRRLRHAFGDADGMARLVAGSLFSDPEIQAFAAERLRRNDMGVIRRTMVALARFDATSRLPAVTSPVLVLAGDRDRTVPFACAEALARGLPDARLIVIPDAGHALPYDQPDVFVGAVSQFLC
jgi:aminoacrylate hydrolase